MGVLEIVGQIDQEIAHLQHARALIAGQVGPAQKKIAPVKKKRNISPEGRKRIAEAVKRRWAEQKKAASSN